MVRYAIKKGCAYINWYDKATRLFVKREWLTGNLPNQKENTSQ